MTRLEKAIRDARKMLRECRANVRRIQLRRAAAGEIRREVRTIKTYTVRKHVRTYWVNAK